jgi:hypothetical protein
MGPRKDLTKANAKINTALTRNTGKVAGALFASLGSWRDGDIAGYVDQVKPVLSGAKAQVTKSTVAYYGAVSKISGQKFVAPVVSATEMTTAALRNGATTEMVYARPFVEMRTALAKGSTVKGAIEAGARRANQLAQTEVALAKRAVGAKTRKANTNIVGYARTLTGAENCAMCYVASTQRYHSGDLLPIHPGCDCGEMPLYGNQDPGQVIDQARLDGTHESVQARFGESDLGARAPDYRDIMITKHGEMGPVLSIKGHKAVKLVNLPTPVVVAEAVATAKTVKVATTPKVVKVPAVSEAVAAKKTADAKKAADDKAKKLAVTLAEIEAISKVTAAADAAAKKATYYAMKDKDEVMGVVKSPLQKQVDMLEAGLIKLDSAQAKAINQAVNEAKNADLKAMLTKTVTASAQAKAELAKMKAGQVADALKDPGPSRVHGATRTKRLPTRDMKAGVANYQAAGYGPLNRNLRGATNEIYNTDVLDQLDSLMAVSTLTKTTVVTRSVNGEGLGLTRYNLDRIEDLAGETLQDPGFMSVTTQPGAFRGGAVTLKLTVPAGTKAVDVNGLLKGDSSFSTEYEIILNRGTKYKITSVRPADLLRDRYADGTKWVVEAEVIE